MKQIAMFSKTDVSHLGTLIGDAHSDRIIALSTSTVFNDTSLPETFWGIDDTAIDSGFQGHIYTRPNDILILRVPHCNETICQMVMTAINLNQKIWKTFTGIEISSAASRLILACNDAHHSKKKFAKNIIWHKGSLPDAAATRYQNNTEALLAFVCNSRLLAMLKSDHSSNPDIVQLAQNTSLLMDKNNAMEALQQNGVKCAATYFFNENANLDTALKHLPLGKYVFKPAGGAAGIGVFSNKGSGADADIIRHHLNDLKSNNQLPQRFQIQEYLQGMPLGATACIYKDGTFDIFEIHQQIINDTGRFTGGKWSLAHEADQMEAVSALYRKLAAIDEPRFLGLICLDFIEGKIIEINPRLTASAPIAHILRRQNQLARHNKNGLSIKHIDLNTTINIPYKIIENGGLQNVIKAIWKEHNVLILPQGLNPFGSSRLIFINDDANGTSQQLFIKQMEN